MKVTERTRTFAWADPIATLQSAAGMSGLEYMRAMLAGEIPMPPMAVTLGFDGGSVEEGRAVFEAEPREYLYNPIGVVHGGFAMTILDSAMGCAIHTTLPAGVFYTTLETKVNLVRAITVDTGRVRCEGVVVHRGGKVATAEGRLTAMASGKLLAHGTTTCLVTER